MKTPKEKAMSFEEYPSLQQGYKEKKKRGWCRCDDCGVLTSFSDKSIVKSHVNGKGCKAFREVFE